MKNPASRSSPKARPAKLWRPRYFQRQTQQQWPSFRTLNPQTDNVKAGSLIVLSDPNNFQCSKENQLLEAAALTNDAINPLSAADADFMMRHREQIQSFLAHSSTAIGAGETSLARNLDNLQAILQEIEALHQKAFLKDGHLRSPEFFAERKNLLARLDTRLSPP